MPLLRTRKPREELRGFRAERASLGSWGGQQQQTLQSFEYCAYLQGDGEAFFLKECTKRHIDSTDRRFCFDIEAADR